MAEANFVRCYVYALVDPRDELVFYIGKGTGRRYACHEADWRAGRIGNIAKHQRFEEIHGAGERVRVVCLGDDLTRAQATRMERFIIGRIGIENLTNLAPGHSTDVERAVAKARDLLARVKPFAVWLREQTRTDKDKALYVGVVEGLQKVLKGCESRGIA